MSTPKRLDPIRSLIRHTKSGRIGVVMANDSCGGVFRGHMDCWFGRLRDGVPVVLQVPVDQYEEVECPLGESETRRCVGCGRALQTSPKPYRVGRLFCSDPCRFKAYRERKSKARMLYRKGHLIPDIAEKLSSTRKIVQGWVRGIHAVQ